MFMHWSKPFLLSPGGYSKELVSLEEKKSGIIIVDMFIYINYKDLNAGFGAPVDKYDSK